MTLVADISHWQGTIDFAALRGHVDAVWCKATQGSSSADPAFAGYLAAAHNVGIPVGAYHFASPSPAAGDAVAEADWFCSHWEGRCELRPMLDLESSDLVANLTDDWALAFLARVKARTGAEPIIYAGPGWSATHLEPNPALALYDLWVAHYTTDPAPKLPAPWGHWLLWQYTSTGTVSGIAGHVDLDRVNGSLADLLITPPAIPDPQPLPEDDPVDFATFMRSVYLVHLGREPDTEGLHAFGQDFVLKVAKGVPPVTALGAIDQVLYDSEEAVKRRAELKAAAEA